MQLNFTGARSLCREPGPIFRCETYVIASEQMERIILGFN